MTARIGRGSLDAMFELLLATALQNAAVPIETEVLEGIRAPAAPICSVTLHVGVDEAGEPFDRSVYRYDAPSDEWSLVSFNGGPPPEEELEEFEKNGRDGGDRSDDPVLPGAFYADSVSKLSADWVRLSPSEETEAVLYGLEDLPEDTVIANGRDLSDNIRLQFLIEKAENGPRIAMAFGQLKKSWRIPLIARIDRFDIARRFAPASQETGVPGAMLPVAEHVEISADVLGKDRSAVIDTTYGDWDCEPGSTDES
ncbi:hypothetical protein [Parvularcula dongshanensis]|uniref:Uncharacterized protein n=1 Tax=Parvularcula dongshanensis TaxID=1173995 RepID=A0A840I573_9PROT|nr:hypothetical protein [Parvularcula dongshanensis]MBB4659989.1 hypothetical protein [Parvularcula dongshanensis]